MLNKGYYGIIFGIVIILFCNSNSFYYYFGEQSMRVVPVPVLDDNYAYLLIDTESNVAAAVDPAGAQQAFDAAKKENVKIVAILTTHHHW